MLNENMPPSPFWRPPTHLDIPLFDDQDNKSLRNQKDRIA